MTIKVTKDYQGLVNLKRKVPQLAKSSVEVGIFEDSVYTGTERKEQLGHNAGVPVATIAAIQEEGAHNGGHPIPARPFRAQTINSILRNPNRLGDEILRALTGSVPKAMQDMGKRFKDIMYMIVDSWNMNTVHPDNAPRTIAEKGFNKTLEWTGTMLKSIDYRVKAGGKD